MCMGPHKILLMRSSFRTQTRFKPMYLSMTLFSLYFLSSPLITHTPLCFPTHPIHETYIEALWNSSSLILQAKKESCLVQAGLNAQAVYLDCVLETLWAEGN